MLRQKQHAIMQERLELWRKKQKTNKTPTQTKKRPPPSNSISRNKPTCGRDINELIYSKTTRQNIQSRQKRRSIRKEQRLKRGQMPKPERSTTRSREQDVQHEVISCSQSPTMREKLEAWLVEKKQRMAFERSQVKLPVWNSNKRKLAVSRIQWESEENIKLRDIKTSRYLGNYGPAKVHRSTDSTQNHGGSKTMDLKENVSVEESGMVESSVDAEELETVTEGASMEVSRRHCGGHESRVEKDRRVRLEEWLIAKGKTPHSVRRSVRRETFDVLRLNPDQVVEKEQEAKMERKRIDEMNSTIDECLQSCLDFMNEMKCENKVGDWLQELIERCPQVRGRALFWVCQARVAEHDDLGQHQILALYEQAIDNNAKPTNILKSALQDFTIRHSNIEDTIPCVTPKPLPRTPRPAPSSTLKYCNTPHMDKNASSVVRYCLVESTPIIDRFNESVDGSSKRFLVTPVRRSIRIEKSGSRVQSNLRNSRCVASLQELPQDTECLIMRPNRALEEEFTGTVNQ